ncbi:unnamed protein product [Effrenium voratum]|uniref:Uncharacterized protein n=1 Tax=Effrenium voratum TaxID=2562239 RepID=A0AA36IKB3_9DINO|nr:unnamed protein product [Effrenium voratum]
MALQNADAVSRARAKLQRLDKELQEAAAQHWARLAELERQLQEEESGLRRLEQRFDAQEQQGPEPPLVELLRSTVSNPQDSAESETPWADRII